MKYKVGDRVRIKSLDWYNENKGNADKTNSVWCEDGGAWFFYHMTQYCGKIMTIESVWALSYTLEGSDSRWTDEMIECKVEETITTNEQLFKPSNISLEKEMEWNLPEGYQFVDENGNVINATKIVLEKKKKEYPKTYEECCRIMDIDKGFLFTSYNLDLWKGRLLTSLQKLLICRDAYWKIAGEEMGLNKPWEPDFLNPTKEIRYFLFCTGTTIENGQALFPTNKIFIFPTEEMRDSFKENFDPDIEICKELL